MIRSQIARLRDKRLRRPADSTNADGLRVSEGRESGQQSECAGELSFALRAVQKVSFCEFDCNRNRFKCKNALHNKLSPPPRVIQSALFVAANVQIVRPRDTEARERTEVSRSAERAEIGSPQCGGQRRHGHRRRAYRRDASD